jgi:hypothetical protein
LLTVGTIRRRLFICGLIRGRIQPRFGRVIVAQ